MNKKICYALLGILCSSIETGFCSSTPSGSNLKQSNIIDNIKKFNTIADGFVKNYSAEFLETEQYKNLDNNGFISALANAAQKYNVLDEKCNGLKQLILEKGDADQIRYYVAHEHLNINSCKATYDAFKSTVVQKLYQQYVLESKNQNENAKKSEDESIKSLIDFINQDYLECDDNAILNNQTEEALKSLVILQQSLYPVLTYIKHEITKLTPDQRTQLFNPEHRKQRVVNFRQILQSINGNGKTLKNISLLFNQIVLMMSKPSKDINDIYRFTQENILDNVKNTYNINEYLRALAYKTAKTEDSRYDKILIVIINQWIQSRDDSDKYLQNLNVQDVVKQCGNVYQQLVQDTDKNLLYNSISDVINKVKNKPILQAFDTLITVILFLSKNTNK